MTHEDAVQIITALKGINTTLSFIAGSVSIGIAVAGMFAVLREIRGGFKGLNE